MVNICVAYTESVNPPGVSPTLTIPQIWAGLVRKVHHPEEFIQPITDVEVLEEESDTCIKRRVQYAKYRNLLPLEAVEVVTLHEPMKVR